MIGKKLSTSIFFDVLFITSLLTMIVWAMIDFHMVSALTPIIFLFVGFAFLLSKKIKDISFVGKVSYWICYNVMRPSTKYNYLIWGTFAIILGVASALLPVSEDIENQKFLWDSLRKDINFWFSMIAILLLNFLVGLYTAYRRKKREKKARDEKGGAPITL